MVRKTRHQKKTFERDTVEEITFVGAEQWVFLWQCWRLLDFLLDSAFAWFGDFGQDLLIGGFLWCANAVVVW